MQLLQGAGLPAACITDFEAKSLHGVVELMSYATGGLANDPPRQASVVSLLKALRNGDAARAPWPADADGAFAGTMERGTEGATSSARTSLR